MTAEQKRAAELRAELTATNPNSKEAIRKAIADAIANGAKVTKGKTPDVNSKRSFTFKGVHAGKSHVNHAENKAIAKLDA